MNINFDGKSIYCTDKGSGDAVVFLHGWGADMQSFSFLEAPIIEAGFRTVMIDLPGHGKSEEPDRAYSLSDYTAAVKTVLSALSIERPTLIGHSNGGRVVIDLLANEGYDAKRAVLIDSAGIIPKRSLGYRIKVFRYKLGKKLISAFCGKNKDAVLERYKRSHGSADYKNVSGVMRDSMVKLVNTDLEPSLHKISVPTLLIWGENDTATPLSDGKRMNELISDSGLVVLEGGSHWAFAEQGGKTLAVLLSFLRS